MRLPWRIWLPALLLAPGAAADKAEIDVSLTEFSSPPHNLFLFDDSETAVFTDKDAGVVYRSTSFGEKWSKVDDIPRGGARVVYKHPFDNQVAIAVGQRRTHWITKDQGKSWREFETDEGLTPAYPLSFHAGDSDRILLQGKETCDFYGCIGKTWYTKDGFETLDLLHGSRKMCSWAKTHDRFTTGNKDRDQNLVVCIVEGKYSRRVRDHRILMSDDYFRSNGVEPEMADGRTVSGMVNMAAVKGYILAAAKSEGTDELALYVTNDANTWHRAEFGEHKLEEDAYTILESTNYSVQVDVMPSRRNQMGVLFTSNSNGTYFTRNIEHTNRNEFGLVDFEKITDIQGIVLVNTVDNWQEVEKSWLADKMVKSSISFDDGRTFQDLRVGKEKLHLHSVTDQRNAGKVFSSPAPGLVMGIGNTGDSLRPYDQGDLFVSDDAGLTWREALKGPHMYEFGDQGAILVAVYEGETDQVMYSVDHGRNWEAAKLDEGNKFRPLEITTIPDSTSLKFVLVGVKGGGSKIEHHVYSLDFKGLHERKCKEGDFERWYVLDGQGEEGKARCLMGHKQWYRRRKADADCFVDEEFKDPEPGYEPCTCTDEDFECDYNFVRSEDRKQCLPAGKLSPPEGACKNIDDDFMGSSGWRLIPGNDCIRKGGVKKDEPTKRPCRDTVKPPANGQVTHEITTFRASDFKEYHYLERTDSSTGDDETVVMLTGSRVTYISHDHGKNWAEAVPDDKVVAIYPHRYFNDVVYFITPSKTVYYSKNRGKTIHDFRAPERPNQDQLQIMGFHPSEKDWIIWTGGKDCGTYFNDNCHTVAHISQKGGEEWSTLLPYVQKCEFVSRQGSEQLAYCEQYKDEDTTGPLQLIASEDWFEHRTTLFKDVVNFATMSEFIVVATKADDPKYLTAHSSIDGKTFAQADFPPNFQVRHQSAYTVLDSSTHAIFLHVTVNNNPEQEYGSIIKSNSNGTSYVLALNDVSRNTRGYVDFEKMQGLEGVAVVNVVANVKEVEGGSLKKLKTQITHNDGAEWQLLTPPDKDADGKTYCTGDPNRCSLHLHGYTERKDPSRDTFSSASAVGLMMGVGNVGEYLGRYEEADTFITRDGGITWDAVMKGTFMWEYGDQGSIIVIVEESTPTDRVYYTRDEGRTWTEYQFSDAKMLIKDISTVPSDTSRNFLLWGKETTSAGNIVTINLDFTGLTDRECRLNEKDPTASDSDYYLWEPKHPLLGSNCLFGHIAQYHRKKVDADCYNGKREIVHLHNITRDCPCTRQDFECDYNYERQNDGTCALVPGLSPPDPMQICKDDPNAIEYHEVTGYRRIPITTCRGGKQMDALAWHPCPGHEDEYREKRGLSGLGLFLAVAAPVAAAAAVGYWVWRSWDGKFGRIRLGDAAAAGLDGERPWVKWPVAAVSGLVAVLAAVPLLAASLWRSVAGRVGGGYGGPTYTSRSSFARGRGDYAVVDPDEGELLGEDSDEEV